MAVCCACGRAAPLAAQAAGDGHDERPLAGMVRSPGQEASRPAAIAEPAPAPPRRATGRAFGEALRVEVRGMPTAQADPLLRDAVREIREIEELTTGAGDAGGAGLAALQASAGTTRAVDPRLAELLERALHFCRWSRGAHGPLGGDLYELWEQGGRGAARPTPAVLRGAVAATSCDGLEVDPAASTARLAAGRRLDLRGFARGFAVDRAVALLRQHGAANGFVEVGWVRRAFGPGIDAAGWPVILPVFPGEERPVDRLRLRDRALAVVSTVHRPLVVAGDRLAPWLDQRAGIPAEGVVGVAAATELAVDAEALAVSLTVLGNREGMLRLVALRPSPAVLWLLGDGNGAPLVTHHHWSDLLLER